MEVRFADKGLALIETDAAAKTKLPTAVIISARRKLQFIRNAMDERDLRAWRSLHYEKLSGKRDGQHSIRLNDKWRLIIQLDQECSPEEIVIVAIEDYH